MTDTIETALLSLVDRLSGRLTEAAMADIRDWIRHREWYIAVETLADDLHQAGLRVSADEWAVVADVVVQMGGNSADYAFIAPPEPPGE